MFTVKLLLESKHYLSMLVRRVPACANKIHKKLGDSSANP
ncbi:hypothetical protein HMPREF1581_01515 [Gardnerella vaginalis JCP8108]|uniref:Uncharacterized protein n=1 Tax=Gardnerella vaginalis JCP8108 TaxID=1261066 RepID=S4GT65_GARVA|nr:hypothetical protein HMPREF1581_01515 [Gardnerella vaginalis JCP8108]